MRHKSYNFSGNSYTILIFADILNGRKSIKMKKIAFCLLLIVSIVFSSCSSGENGPDPSPVVNTMTQSNWRVSEYIISGGVSVSGNYSGYNFTFSPDGTVTATDGVNTATGDWSVRNFDNDRLKFIIDFYNPETFTYLTNSWRIRFRSADKIILDINEFNYVVFEKN